MDNETQYELYRKSTLGTCLVESLDELINNDTLSEEMALKVLKQFDKSINEALNTEVENSISFKGKLHTYRFCDNVWTLILNDAEFKMNQEVISTDLVKTVACDASLFKK